MWKHVTLEGFCDQDCPVRRSPQWGCDCLENKCRHFSWCESTEREVAFWVPWHLVLWDKIKEAVISAYRKLMWWLAKAKGW